MGSTLFDKKIISNVESKRKITFNDEPQFYTIMESNEENIYNDNDLDYRNSLSLTNTTNAAKKDTNFNYIEQKQQHKANMENNPSESVNKVQESPEENIDEEEKDISLEIISDKVVLLMMSTGGVTDKYTPAVRSMQEGKLISIIYFTIPKNFL